MACWPRPATRVLAVLAVAVAAGCGPVGGEAPVGDLRVVSTDLAASMAEAGIGVDAAREAGVRALSAAGLRMAPGRVRSWRAEVEVVAFSLSAPRSGRVAEAEVTAEVALRPGWAVGPVFRQAATARRPSAGKAPSTALAEALAGALDEASRAIALDLGSTRRSTAELVADLDRAEPAVRERALRALARRGATREAAAVARRIRDPAPAVVAAAVDALTSFRAPGSVLSLIEASQSGEVGGALRLIPVLVEIGGPDVEGYLLTLESGHADRRVREAARAGRETLRGAAGAGARR